LRLQHPIFNTPLQAGVKLEPNDWEKEYDGRGTWLVQTGKLGSGKGNDYGVVSDGHGFEDSPDCERISGGINSKGPHAIAIGRQANLLQWGFYAAPDRMTASAKKVFLNAIVYMMQFDGHRPLVQKRTRSRKWYVQYVEMVRSLASRDEKSKASYEKYLKGRFPSDVIAKCGLDPDALEKWRIANEGYIHSVKRYQLGVDADLHKLKLSNNKPEFLDWVVKRLGEDPRDGLALRLAKRYLGEAGGDAKTAISWINNNRSRLFFSDQGGFQWFVNTLDKTAPR
jgi:hypothetical protein